MGPIGKTYQRIKNVKKNNKAAAKITSTRNSSTKLPLSK